MTVESEAAAVQEQEGSRRESSRKEDIDILCSSNRDVIVVVDSGSDNNDGERDEKVERLSPAHQLGLAEGENGKESHDLNTSSCSSVEMFWEMIDHRPLWQQRLAKVCLQCLLLHSKRNHSSLRTKVRVAFYYWSRQSSRRSLMDLQEAHEEAKATNSHLEQRVHKLKSLLAKVHHSNQKNTQHSNTAKQNQLEAAEALRQRVLKEQLQSKQLQEQLRYMTFESAFQSDMEMIIEKAANQLKSYSDGCPSEGDQTAEKVKELEDIIKCLEQDKVTQQTLIESLHEEIRELEDGKRVKSKELSLQRQRVSEVRHQNDQLQDRVNELSRVQKELEMEIRTLVHHRANVAAEVDSAASSKSEQMISEIRQQLEIANQEVSVYEDRVIKAERKLDCQLAEISSLQSRLREMTRVKAENENLNRLLQELKRSSGALESRKKNEGERALQSSTEISAMKLLVSTIDDICCSGPSKVPFQLFNKYSTFYAQYTKSSKMVLQSLVDYSSKFNMTWRAVVLRELDEVLGLGDHGGRFGGGQPLFDMEHVSEALTSCSKEAICDALVEGKRSLVHVLAGTCIKLQNLEIEAVNNAAAVSCSNGNEDMTSNSASKNHETDIFNWNASSISLQSGKELNLPIPVPQNTDGELELNWEIRGIQLESLELSLGQLKKDDTPPFVLPSELVLASKVDSASPGSGKYITHGAVAVSASKGDQLLKICNRASWVTSSFSYEIRLRLKEEVKPSVDHAEPLQEHQAAVDLAISRCTENERSLRSRLKEGMELRRTYICHAERWEAAHSALQAVVSKHLECAGDSVGALQKLRECLESSRRQQSRQLAEASSRIKPIRDYVFGPAEASLQSDALGSLLSTARDSDSSAAKTTPCPLSFPRTVYSSEQLRIPSSRDFRCPISTPLMDEEDEEGFYLISWDFALLPLEGSTSSGAADQDIGFCVLGKSSDGSLPQIVPYRRYGANGEVGHAGVLRYRACSKSEVDFSEPLSGQEDVTGPFSEIIVLFDNSYSWFTSKAIKYDITVDRISNNNESLETAASHPIAASSSRTVPDPVTATASTEGCLEDDTSQVVDSALASTGSSDFSSRVHQSLLELGTVEEQIVGISRDIVRYCEEVHELKQRCLVNFFHDHLK